MVPEHLLEPQEDEGVDIWPEHEQVVELFLRSCRQLRAAREAILGLDYNAVAWISTLMGIEVNLMLLDDLQVMEARAVELLNDRGKS